MVQKGIRFSLIEIQKHCKCAQMKLSTLALLEEEKPIEKRSNFYTNVEKLEITGFLL